MANIILRLPQNDYRKFRRWVKEYEIVDLSNLSEYFEIITKNPVEIEGSTHDRIQDFCEDNLQIYRSVYFSVQPEILKRGIGLETIFQPEFPEDVLDELGEYLTEIIEEHRAEFNELFGDNRSAVYVSSFLYKTENSPELKHECAIYYKENREEFKNLKLHERLVDILTEKMGPVINEYMEDLLYEAGIYGEIVGPQDYYKIDMTIRVEINFPDEGEFKMKTTGYWEEYELFPDILVLPEKNKKVSQ